MKANKYILKRVYLERNELRFIFFFLIFIQLFPIKKRDKLSSKAFREH